MIQIVKYHPNYILNLLNSLPPRYNVKISLNNKLVSYLPSLIIVKLSIWYQEILDSDVH